MKQGNIWSKVQIIVKYLNESFSSPILTAPQDDKIAEWINEADNVLDRLTTPLYIQMDLPELGSDKASDAYRAIHVGRAGDFDALKKESPELLAEGVKSLLAPETLIDIEQVKREEYSLDDILLYPMSRHISSIKEINSPSKISEYIVLISQRSQLPSYADKAVTID